jgi:hypothetical protein
MMELRPDLVATITAMRAQRAQWETMAGETITMHRGAGMKTGHPTLPAPCRCRTPIRDEDTCVLCGKGLP